MDLEEHARVVELAGGVKIAAFWDPAHYPPGHRLHKETPVKRWRVQLPTWFPKGSWLEGQHAFTSLDAALTALQDTGALEAIDTLWRAQLEQGNARNAAFSKVMSAYARTDKRYTDMLRERHERQRRALDALEGGRTDG